MAIEIRPMQSGELVQDDYLRRILVDIIANVTTLGEQASPDAAPVVVTETGQNVPIAPTATPAQTGAIAITAATVPPPLDLPATIATVDSHAADLQTLEAAVNSLIADVRSLISTYNALIETLRAGGTVQ